MSSIGLYRRRSMLHVPFTDNGIGLPEKLRTASACRACAKGSRKLAGRLMFRAGKPGMVLMASVPLHGETRAVGDLALAG